MEDGGIEGFLKREVLSYAEDAWCAQRSVKTGYEINFNRYFYKPQTMRSLDVIGEDIRRTERVSDGLLGAIIA